MPTLALCIPAYNAAAFLPRLLQSALEQSVPFDEILVYDDCSTDDTGKIAAQYGATIIRGNVNVGCSTGKNKLAEIAKSDWLHFHDADDDLLPNFTKVAHNWMQNPSAPDIVLLQYQYKNIESGMLLYQPDYNRTELLKDPVRFNIVNKVVNFALIKKGPFQKVGGFNTNPLVLYNEDRAFYTRAAIEGLHFDYEPELTCINYYYPGSMSAANQAKCAQAVFNVWAYVLENTNQKYNQEIAAQLLLNATFAASAHDWVTTKKCIEKARQINPGVVPYGSWYFKLLYKIMPLQSFRLREILLTKFKPKALTK